MLGNKIKILIPILLLVVGITQAQDAAPWPPDPADIFAPGVEVVSVEINHLPVVDNEARVLQVLNEKTRSWQTYNYPDEVKNVDVVSMEDGLVLLNVTEQNTQITHLWILDPVTGVFNRYENRCIDWEWHAQNGTPITTLMPHWEFYNDANIGRTSLCFTGTGKSEFLLPEVGYWQSIRESPDSEWLLLLNSDEEYLSTRSIFHAYGYSIETKQLHYLGDFSLQEQSDLRWISDTVGLYYAADMPEYGAKEYYYFDLSQPDSLHYLMTGWADYHDDPPRYEYLQSYYEVTHRADTFGNYPECELEVYYLSQQEPIPTIYPLSKDCFGNVVRNQNRYFYIGYGELEPTTLTLYSLNTETDEKKAWFSDAELLALDSVSPSGRYAVLMLNDGDWPAISFSSDFTSERSIPLENLDPWIYRNHGIVSSHMAIYDIIDKRLIYDNDHWQDYGVTIWLDDTHFLTIDNEGQHPIRRFHVIENGLEQAEINLPEKSSPWFSPNYQSAAFMQEAQVNVYQLMTGHMIPIIVDLHSDYYEIVGLKWIDSEQLSINLAPIERVPFDKPAVIYTIRIPQ